MLDFITSQRAAFVLALSDLYRPGRLVQPGARVSDGRGGFTAATFEGDIRVHQEQGQEALRDYNIEPDQALIYILNDDPKLTPGKGDTITLDGSDYQILSMTTDPVKVAWECVCARG